jgi:DNA-directed RNA polymerase subunit RPC12/RpoP
MWKCERCGEEIEDQFDSCWKCTQPEPEPASKAPQLPMQCLRCQGGMEYEGRKHLHESAWTDLLLHRVHVDVYVCSQCGRLELFAPEDDAELIPN